MEPGFLGMNAASYPTCVMASDQKSNTMSLGPLTILNNVD